MLVYRIEDVIGDGPYVSLLVQPFNDHYSRKRPAPSMSKLDHVGGHKFGFSSLRHLVRWFDKCRREKLCATGMYCIAVYDAPPEHVQIGTLQLTFKREASKLLEKHAINSPQLARKLREAAKQREQIR